MSKKAEEILLVSELRKRIDNLKTIDKPGPFFREVARLAGWISSVTLFEEPLIALDLQSKNRDDKALEILKEIHGEGKKIWLAIKKIPIPLDKDKTPEMVQHSLADLMQYYNLTHPQYGIGIYHSLRYVVEHLASGENAKKVERFVDRNNDVKYPNLRGKIYDLFIDYNKGQDLTKKELATSLWGAWDNLKYVNYLASMDNDYPQLEDWAKVFTKDEYFVHLYKVSDYLIDWLVLDKGIIQIDADKLAEPIAWEKNFRLEGNYAKFGQYGEVRFYPERSPRFQNKQDKEGINPVMDILNKLFGTLGKGLDEKLLLKNASFEKRDISSLVSNINSVFLNALESGKIKARVRIVKKGNLYQLIVMLLNKPKEETITES